MKRDGLVGIVVPLVGIVAGAVVAVVSPDHGTGIVVVSVVMWGVVVLRDMLE